jgi:threonine/homoserine/homoserine lactone efflux protein
MIDGNLFGTHDFFTFLLAVIALNLLPGQDSLYIIGRSLAQGRMAGVCSVIGIGSGCLVHITAAALGFSAILALFPHALVAISLLGALYLVWLGISPWLSRDAKKPGFTIPDTSERMWVVFWQGFFTNLLNPKVALFFLAFLPSFIDPGSGTLSFLFLGGTFFITGTVWCLVLALCASAFADALRGNERIQRGFSLVASTLFIALGAGIFLTHL